MKTLSEQEKLADFMLKMREAEAERTGPAALRFHVVEADGSLRELPDQVMFVQTGPDSGFILYKGVPVDNECLMYSYPGFGGSERNSRFITKACCSNMLEMEIEVDECDDTPEQGDPPDSSPATGSEPDDR